MVPLFLLFEIIQSIRQVAMYSPAVVKFDVRHVGTSVGTSEVDRKLTEDTEDVREVVGVPIDFLFIENSIHKPDSKDIDRYEFF